LGDGAADLRRPGRRIHLPFTNHVHRLVAFNRPQHAIGRAEPEATCDSFLHVNDGLAPVHYSNGDKTGIGSAGQAVHWKINPRSNPTLKRTGLIFRSRLPTGSKKLTRVGDGSSRKLPAKKMGGQTYQPPAPPLMNVR